ncbi:MAG: hypothetical protein OEM32_11455 [Acidimicrobiia bacterium]|nr:hypothetical protein [Acidimicrobiia bacterium]
MRRVMLPALPLTAILIWLIALMVDRGPYGSNSVLLIGIGWLVLATVGTVGLVLAGGRWARRLLLALLASTLVPALLRQFDTAWLVAEVATVLAVIALLSARIRRRVRQLSSAVGPPPKAVVAALIPLSLPLWLGLMPREANGWVLAVALAGVGASFLYSRTIPGGLVSLRFGLPLITLALAVPAGLTHWLTALAVVGAGTVVAWHNDVAVAFRPLVEQGTTYAIPPELAPREILDRAGIDEQGRRV